MCAMFTKAYMNHGGGVDCVLTWEHGSNRTASIGSVSRPPARRPAQSKAEQKKINHTCIGFAATQCRQHQSLSCLHLAAQWLVAATKVWTESPLSQGISVHKEIPAAGAAQELQQPMCTRACITIIWPDPANNEGIMNRQEGHAQRGMHRERAAPTQHPACRQGACRRCETNAATNDFEPVPRRRHVSRHVCLSAWGCTQVLQPVCLPACLYTSGWHWLQV